MKYLHQSHTSGSVLQMALYYLEAICAKVPKLEGEDGTGCTGKILMGYLASLDIPHAFRM
jgi:hypothetical protein